MPQTPAITARGLTIKVGKTVLLQPMDLTFQPGEFVALLGPSGCGKSTLLRSLAGMQDLSGGQTLLQGRPVAEMTGDERRKIGFVPQDDVVHGSLAVERTLLYTGRLLGLEGDALKQRVDQVIQLLELQERRKVRTDKLSGGQRKRVSIGVELMGEPQVLFLDEPTAGLDPALEHSFMANCRSLARGGRTLLMSTHVMQSLDAVDLVLILLKGYLIFLGPPAEALQFFGVTVLTQIYALLDGQEPQQWHERYARSSAFATYVNGRR